MNCFIVLGEGIFIIKNSQQQREKAVSTRAANRRPARGAGPFSFGQVRVNVLKM